MINAILIVLLFASSVQAATIRRMFVEFGNSSAPLARVTYTYDNVSNKVQTVDVFKSNNSNLCAQVQELPAGDIDAGVFTHSSGTSTISIPQNGPNSITLTFNAKGQPDNMEGQVMFPYIGTLTPCQ